MTGVTADHGVSSPSGFLTTVKCICATLGPSISYIYLKIFIYFLRRGRGVHGAGRGAGRGGGGGRGHQVQVQPRAPRIQGQPLLDQVCVP